MRCVSLAVVLLCVLVILSGPVQAQVSFFEPMTFPDGVGPLFVADFNGDGKLDLLCSYGCLNVGNGNGTFKSVTPPLGIVLAVADFNHDGKLDLLEEKTNSDTFSVLLGNGDGTFQAAINTPTGGPLGLMAVGDLNGDGYADVLGGYGPVLYVFLSNGDGTFKPGIPNNLGSSLSGTISIADVNGDGKLDVVYNALTSSQSEIIVLLGNGDGTLQAPISAGLPLYYQPFETVVGDFNGDGNPDLVSTASVLSISTYVQLGNGDGTFQSPTAAFVPNGTQFAAADVNGDGKLDLVFAAGVSTSPSAPVSQIYLGNGDGTFAAPSSYVSSFPAGNTLSSPPDGTVVVADFNGDGKPDIASSGGILLGNGDGTFQGIPLATLSNQASIAAIGDFEKNGKPDVAALDQAQRPPYNLYILRNGGSGALSLINTYPMSGPGLQILVGDLNADGNLDLVVTELPSAGGAGYSVLLGNGDGSFQNPVFYSQSTSFLTATLVDVNNDKKLDFVEGGSNVLVGVSLGNGDGTFAATVTYDDLGPWGSTLITGDFNGDGKVDIGVSPPYETPGTVMLYGNGDGTFQAPMIPVNLNGYTATSTADFRDIGRADLFNGSQVALNNGDGSFTFLPPVKYAGFPVADINGDGKVDLLVDYTVQQGCQTGVELGNGDGTFGPLIDVPASGCYPFTNLVADMNGDGKPDIVFLWGPGIGLLLNTTPPGLALSASSPSPARVIAGGSATSTLTAIPIFGSNGAETLSCIGLPTGFSCAFNPASISSSSKTSTLTITTSSSTAAGTYAVQIRGVAGSVTDSVTTSLVVQAAPPAPDFSISFGSGARTSIPITTGQTDSLGLQVAPTGSFAGTVSLSCAVTPAVTAAPTCIPASTSVQISVGKTRVVNLQIGTTAPAASDTAPYLHFPAGPMPLVWSLMFLGSAWLWARNRKRLPVLAAPILVLTFAFSMGCGGNGSSSTHGTAPGTYTATVTGTSGSISHSFAFQVVVQ
jgi:hypothetical protein